jgi:hypothetical protein
MNSLLKRIVFGENSEEDEKSISNTRRFELKMPEKLAKKVTTYAFEHKKSKASVIIEALEKFLN